MIDYKKFFKGKKITVMGLGLLGGAVNDIRYLAENGAVLTVTDLKTAEQLKPSLRQLKKYPKIKFILGKHKIEDFKNTDMVIQPGNVPMDSLYLTEARKNRIPIFVSESLFAKYASGVILVGVTGTRGKSMTTALIYEILKSAGQRVFLGGNVRNVSTLALLEKVKPGDIVVTELDSWALHGMGEIKKSPHISVFTSFMPDHMNYYGGNMKKYFSDKANIFKHQEKGDILVIRPGMKKLISKNLKSLPAWAGKLVVVKPGNFQEENRACAVAVAKQFKISEAKIKQAIKNFRGLEGRLQYVKTVRGVKIYNDNNATTPEATSAGIELLQPQRQDLWGKKIILICGGADKKLPLDNFVKVINKYCKAAVFIPGTGTSKLLKNYKIKIPNKIGENLKEAVKNAQGFALRGDIVLFSPAFASFGMFNNEYERNDLFMKIIKGLK